MMQRRQKSRPQPGRQRKGKPRDVEDNFGDYPAVFSANANRVVFQNPRCQDPFPQRYHTVMHSSIAGYIAAGTGTTQFFVRGNSGYLPWVGGAWPNALPPIATTNPQGFGSLVNVNIYQKFRVMGCRIEIQFQPEAAVDNIIVSVTPTFLAGQPSTVEKALAHEFSRNASISQNTPKSSQTIVNKITTHRLLGVRKQALLDDLTTSYTGTATSTPINTWVWLINFDTSDKTVTVNRTAYRVHVEYDIELFGDSAGADFPLMQDREAYQVQGAELCSPTSASSKDGSSSILLKRYLEQRAREEKASQL